MARHIAGIVVMMTGTVIATSPIQAQSPVEATGGPVASTSPARPLTAAEIERRLYIFWRGFLPTLTDDGRVAPRDSVQAILLPRAHQWLAELKKNTKMSSMQRDPYAALLAGMGETGDAQREFEARLATKGLSTEERGYTLYIASTVFAGPETPEALAIARKYLAQLDALPGDVATWKYSAHVAMANAYYDLGKTADAIAQFEQAFAAIPQIPFEDRIKIVDDAFVTYAVLVAGQPNGRAKIDATGKRFLAFLTPSASLVARDSNFLQLGRNYQMFMQYKITQVSRLGEAAPAIVANHWFNVAAPSAAPQGVDSVPADARALRLDDGTIRLLEFGEYGCHACVEALPVMDELRDSVPPGVQVWYVTKTEGSWGITQCTPAEEAAHLRTFYVDNEHRRLPIAVWAGPRDVAIDDGSTPRQSPNVKAYGISSTPTFVLIDGHGIVRHLEVGLSSDAMSRIKKRIAYLVAEANHA